MNYISIITKSIIILTFSFFVVSNSYCQIAEIPSSFNPTGSGARALGINAFIAIVDDSTAASWNPGGLVGQKKKFEFSLVSGWVHRIEKNDFLYHPEASSKNSIDKSDINFVGVNSTFNKYSYNMSIALTYQHLYDFYREWKFNYIFNSNNSLYNTNYNYFQTGRLSALGLSYCIEILRPELLLGFTLNIWDNDISPNKWTQSYNEIKLKNKNNNVTLSRYEHTEEFTFKGINYNFGLLWRINDEFRIGAVLKTPFKADIDYRIYSPEYTDIINNKIHKDYLYMPMSYGFGFVYYINDNFQISSDFYKTQWDHFIYRKENGAEHSPISGLEISKSNVKPTYHIRTGAEYVIVNKMKEYAIAFRGGLFYDPSPSEGCPDKFLGFSLGIGLTLKDMFSLDLAYQYRYGNNVASSTLIYNNFSQDVYEDKLYFSTTLYF